MDFQEIDTERAARGLSYAAIARVVGVPSSTVRSWVRGERRAPEGMRDAIAAAIDEAEPVRPWGVRDLPDEVRARLREQAQAERRARGHALRALRVAAGLSVAEVAERAGLTPGHLTFIESVGRVSSAKSARIVLAIKGGAT